MADEEVTMWNVFNLDIAKREIKYYFFKWLLKKLKFPSELLIYYYYYYYYYYY